MPLFTVAIPTYNRAHLLPYTLSCLRQQTFREFDIIISDNASTDNTAQVIDRFRDLRIHYVRQPSLLCPGDNWAACADMAQSEWIVFNQDDDALSPLFLERCAHAIKKKPELVMYATDTCISRDITRGHGADRCGFPLCHHWDQPQPRLIPGVQIAALSWFINAFFPPAQATPTQLFRKHWPRGPDAIYLGDHYFTSHVACEGMIAYESYVGAMIREHADRVTHTAPDIVRRRVEAPFVALRAYFEETKVDWKSALQEIIFEFPLAYREWLLNEYLFNEFIAHEAIDILGASIASEKGLSSIDYISNLRSERLKPPLMGRLDRWKFPKALARVIRGALYAVGKDYA